MRVRSSAALLIAIIVLSVGRGSTVAEPHDAPRPAAAAVPGRAIVAGLAGDGAWRRVNVAIVGDVSLGRQVNDWMASEGSDYPFLLVRDHLSADVLAGNLEGVLTSRDIPWPKAYTFSTPPSLAEGLAGAGFDVLSLANNHSMDFGAEGLRDTLSSLDRLGIAHPGAGSDASLATAPTVIERFGLRIAFVAFVLTPDEWTGFSICDWAAGPDSPGVATGSPAVLAESVARARARADFVIVLVHAGTEYAVAPDGTQQFLAAAAVAAGADAVIGAHSHTVQPLAWGGPGTPLIAWSLGNFVFDLDAVDLRSIPEPRHSLVLRLVLTEGVGVTGWRALPVVVDAEQDRPRPAGEAEAASLFAALAARPTALPASRGPCE